MSMMRVLLDALIKARLALTWWLQGCRLRAQARDPWRIQEAVLRRILARNAATTFGERHGFARIRSYDEYKVVVPVADFEALRPDIEAQQRGAKALTAEEPLCYLRTSGTTHEPKDIPLTPSHLAALRRLQRLSVARQLALVPGAFDGSILVFTSPAQEGMLPSGKSYGSASGIVAGSTPAIIRDKFVIPPDVLALTDSHVKYMLMLRLALVHPDVTYLGAANSTTLLTLMRLYREHEHTLLQDVRRGGFSLADRVPPALMRALHHRLQAQPRRAAELEQLRTTTSERRIRDLWPALRLVITWTCASAGIAVKALREELTAQTRILELGYMASEFRGTVTLGGRAGMGFPTLDTHFFEFVERDRWDRGEPEYLTLPQLRKDQDYYIIVTTPSGLYRYFINDLVRVRGRFYSTPLIEFVQKGKGVTNITGEKLYESQVIEAVNAVLHEDAVQARFYILLADEVQCRYSLYVEPQVRVDSPQAEFAARVECRLMERNVEFDAKRSSKRLAPLQAAWLRAGTHDLFKRHCVARGQREGQFKPPVLAYARQIDFDFDSHRVP